LGATLTVKYVFDAHPDDRFACMADVGWITGHTSVFILSVLKSKFTIPVIDTLSMEPSPTAWPRLFESTPVYPTPSHYWETVAKHKLTQFYSAPTAIRLLRRHGSVVLPSKRRRVPSLSHHSLVRLKRNRVQRVATIQKVTTNSRMTK
jgi:acetyl-CoA synthetase